MPIFKAWKNGLIIELTIVQHFVQNSLPNK